MEDVSKRGRLVQKAKSIKLDIDHFILNHEIKNPLPRGGNILILPPVEAPSGSDFTEEEEDELASYLAQAFPELRSLERHDPASLIRDTIKFVINTTTKAKTDTMLNEQSTIENVFEWLLGKGISKETSQIFKDNEIDGFSLLYLTEEDIFRMLPGKVGPARKILQHIKKEQQKSNETEASRDHIQEDTTSKKKEYRGIVVEEFTKDRDQNTTNQCSEYRGIIVEEVETQAHEEKTTHDANIQGQDYTDVSSFIPTYSPLIKELLSKGEIFKEWDKFVEETAYFILSRPAKFESRGMYADFGRMMYQRYPCIGHNAFGDPWGYFNKKLSQKIRNIRWKWNARGKTNTTVKKRRVEPEVKLIEEPMSLLDAGKIFKTEMEKPKKEMDRALIMKALRGSFKERRLFITKKHDGNLKELLRKLPVLGKAEYVEKEFFLIQPSLKKEEIVENWTETMSHLDVVLGSEHQQEEDDVSVPGTAEEYRLLMQLEKKIAFHHKVKSGKNPVMMTIKPSEMKSLPNKDGDPPRLVFVQGDRGICNAYIIAGGIQMEVNTNLRDALTHLLYAYYAWDLSYPKNYLLLGFLQVYVLGDRKNKFAINQNYLKFTKAFDDMKK
nr:uncharacterized protein LOC105324467 [Crassostrea gigas]